MEKKVSYYQLHKAERSIYAKNYYKTKKLKLGNGAQKPIRHYKTWKANQPQIDEHKQYLAKNGIKEVVVRFSI
jgi:hypothetical protein